MTSLPTDSLPSGVVTFLFTDVEGSTHAWEKSPALMAEALVQHDEAIDSAVTAHNGIPVKARGEGDSWFVVFEHALDAVAGAADVQRRLSEVEWVTSPGLVVRASLHTGTADLRTGDYYGPTVNRAARLRSIAHGGQTILSGATHQLVQDQLPDSLTLVDLGEHGLKDLTRPEHVYQLDIDGSPLVFPPLLSLNSVHNNLPIQLTDFVGREEELVEVKRLLSENRFVTILASGGSGKTRLAIQAAAELTGEFRDGVFFIELAGIASGGDIVQAVAESLGLGLSADDDRQTQLLTYLTGKRQLLVFDNFEHVREAAGLVSEILRAAPEVKVVTTSRVKLDVSGETVFNLGGLQITWDSPGQAFETSSVKLFVDSAERVDSAFVLHDEDLQPLSRILNLTSGSPLAILLASAWIDVLSVEEIAREIDKTLDFLETETSGVPDRHRSVRAVFEYSWSLLSEDEQKMFAALSVFRGGFTREAADVVAGASLRDLARFVNKSLLTPDPLGGRFAVHELLRQYAEVELEGDPERCDHVQASHAAFFADVAADAFELFAQSNQPQMLNIVEYDIENIRAAWRHLVAAKDGDGVLRMFPSVVVVYEVRGWLPAGHALFDEAIDAFAEGIDELSVTTYAMLRSSRAVFSTLLGRPAEGATEAAEALNSLPESTDLILRWIALESYVQSCMYLGNVDAVVGAIGEWIDEFDRLEEKLWVSGLKNYLALAATMKGDFDTANRLLTEAMAVYERIDEHYFMTWNLAIQAMIAMESDQPEQASALLTRQIRRSEALGYLPGLVVAYEGLGDANAAAGRMVESEDALVKAVSVAEQMGMIREVLNLMTKVARGRASIGRHAEAVEILAAVCRNPMSEQQALASDGPIRVAASTILEELRADTDTDVYESAYARGATESFDSVLNELLGRGVGSARAPV